MLFHSSHSFTIWLALQGRGNNFQSSLLTSLDTRRDQDVSLQTWLSSSSNSLALCKMCSHLLFPGSWNGSLWQHRAGEFGSPDSQAAMTTDLAWSTHHVVSCHPYIALSHVQTKKCPSTGKECVYWGWEYLEQIIGFVSQEFLFINSICDGKHCVLLGF